MPTRGIIGRKSTQSLCRMLAAAAGLFCLPIPALAAAPTERILMTGALASGIAVSLLGLWLWRRRRSAHAARLGSLGLHGVDTSEFLRQLQAGYRRQGFTVYPAPEAGDSADFVVSEGRRRQLVRCRHWQARRIGDDVVQALVRDFFYCEVDTGALITLGEYTPEAVVSARRAGISLLEGSRLRRFLEAREARPTRRAKPDAGTETHSPPCPKCQGEMRPRRTGSDRRPGEAFWGCLRWPDCTGMAFEEK